MAGGIPVFETLSFLQQVGYALAGAAALWGLYFHVRSERGSGEARRVFDDVAGAMWKPFAGGLVLVAVFWTGMSAYGRLTALLRTGVSASGFTAGGLDIPAPLVHEGITIAPTMTLEAKRQALQVTGPFFLLFTTIFIGGMVYRSIDQDRFKQARGWFYALELILASALISVPVWSGRINTEQLFFIGHSFHSILTVGTVIILDFLMMVTRHDDMYERHIYPVLPDVSKAIWLGLGIEFLSVGFIFHEAIRYTSKVPFMQTLIGILILNGVFLAGPLTERLIASVRTGTVEPLNRRWEIAAGLSGAVSIVSWLAITFVDLIAPLTMGYASLMGIYLGCIAVASTGYEILEHYKVGARL